MSSKGQNTQEAGGSQDKKMDTNNDQTGHYPSEEEIEAITHIISLLRKNKKPVNHYNIIKVIHNILNILYEDLCDGCYIFEDEELNKWYKLIQKRHPSAANRFNKYVWKSAATKTDKIKWLNAIGDFLTSDTIDKLLIEELKKTNGNKGEEVQNVKVKEEVVVCSTADEQPLPEEEALFVEIQKEPLVAEEWESLVPSSLEIQKMAHTSTKKIEQSGKNMQVLTVLAKLIKCENLVYKVYVCAFCPIIINSQEAIIEHYKEHIAYNDHNFYFCDQCDYRCGAANALSMHYRNSHNIYRLYIEDYSNPRCKVCSECFNNAENLKFHYTYHSQMSNFCQRCFYFASSPTALEEHHKKKAINNGEYISSCPLCIEYFSNPTLCREHFKAYHPETKIECEFCNFQSDSMLMKIYHRFYFHFCSFCLEFCQNFKILDEHCNDKHRVKLILHQKKVNYFCDLNSGVPYLYKCLYCNYLSSCMVNISKHTCFSNAVGLFPNTSRIPRLLRMDDLWLCQREGFIDRSNRMLKCKLCSYIVTSDIIMLNHLRKHNPMYQCTICLEVYGEQVKAITHINLMHPQNQLDDKVQQLPPKFTYDCLIWSISTLISKYNGSFLISMDTKKRKSKNYTAPIPQPRQVLFLGNYDKKVVVYNSSSITYGSQGVNIDASNLLKNKTSNTLVSNELSILHKASNGSQSSKNTSNCISKSNRDLKCKNISDPIDHDDIKKSDDSIDPDEPRPLEDLFNISNGNKNSDSSDQENSGLQSDYHDEDEIFDTVIPVPRCPNQVYCKICCKKLRVKDSSIESITQHLNTKDHIKNKKKKNSSKSQDLDYMYIRPHTNLIDEKLSSQAEEEEEKSTAKNFVNSKGTKRKFDNDEELCRSFEIRKKIRIELKKMPFIEEYYKIIVKKIKGDHKGIEKKDWEVTVLMDNDEEFTPTQQNESPVKKETSSDIHESISSKMAVKKILKSKILKSISDKDLLQKAQNKSNLKKTTSVDDVLKNCSSPKIVLNKLSETALPSPICNKSSPYNTLQNLDIMNRSIEITKIMPTTSTKIKEKNNKNRPPSCEKTNFNKSISVTGKSINTHKKINDHKEEPRKSSSLTVNKNRKHIEISLTDSTIEILSEKPLNNQDKMQLQSTTIFQSSQQNGTLTLDTQKANFNPPASSSQKTKYLPPSSHKNKGVSIYKTSKKSNGTPTPPQSSHKSNPLTTPTPSHKTKAPDSPKNTANTFSSTNQSNPIKTKPLYKCDSCSYVTITLSNVFKHFVVKHPEKRILIPVQMDTATPEVYHNSGYRCSLCSKIGTKHFMLEHLLKHAKFICIICLFHTNDQEKIKSHKRTCQGYTCTICTFNHKQIKPVEQHYQWVHTDAVCTVNYSGSTNYISRETEEIIIN